MEITFEPDGEPVPYPDEVTAKAYSILFDATTGNDVDLMEMGNALDTLARRLHALRARLAAAEARLTTADALADEFENYADVMSDMTTDQFSRGKDTPYRNKVREALEAYRATGNGR